MDKEDQVHFFIGAGEDGSFCAATNSSPYLCIIRETEAEVIKAALKALETYFKVVDAGSSAGRGSLKVKETSRRSFTSVEKRFIPEQVVYAEVCKEAC